MILLRSVTSLTKATSLLKSLQELGDIEIKVWPRGRRLSLIVKYTARDNQDKNIGEESYEIYFQLEPIGTSSSKSGYDRWLVYLDEAKVRLLSAPSTDETYTRPTTTQITRVAKRWTRYIEEDIASTNKIRVHVA